MPVTLKITGLEELEAKLSKLDGRLQRVMQLAAIAVGHEVKRIAGQYPPRKYVPLSAVGGFASDKSRRFFFAALREGKIDVPYRRGVSPGSERLGTRWHVEKHGRTGAAVGNPVSYAPYVHSPGGQTSMMAAIGWPTTEDIRDKVESGGRIKRIVQKVIGDALAWLGL